MVCLVALLCVLASPAGRARAEGDGVYGRLDRDVWWSVGAIGGARLDGGDAQGLVEGELRARYLDAAGPVVAGSYLPGSRVGRLFVGLELRPFFPARFLMNLASGNAWLDLFVDSIGVELGVAFGPWGPGAELDAGTAFAWGLGVELPIVLPTVWPGAGLHLRLATRRVRARAGDLGGPQGGADEWNVLCGLVVRGSVEIGLVGGDRPR